MRLYSINVCRCVRVCCLRIEKKCAAILSISVTIQWQQYLLGIIYEKQFVMRDI